MMTLSCANEADGRTRAATIKKVARNVMQPVYSTGTGRYCSTVSATLGIQRTSASRSFSNPTGLLM